MKRGPGLQRFDALSAFFTNYIETTSIFRLNFISREKQTQNDFIHYKMATLKYIFN